MPEILRILAVRRWWRILAATTAGVLALFAAAEFVATVSGVVQRGEFGRDLGTYLQVARHWIRTGAMYYPQQLAGPYLNTGDVNLYPPPAILLFMPFLVLPTVLWWIVPLGITTWAVAEDRPAWWSWPFLAAAFVPLDFHAGVAMGNTTMWAVAAIALATRRPSAAVFLALKPSVLPIALLFARHRSWWLASLGMGLVGLAFFQYWPEWWTGVRNLTGHDLLTYSLSSLPLLMVPVVAHVARTDERPKPSNARGTDRCYLRELGWPQDRHHDDPPMAAATGGTRNRRPGAVPSKEPHGNTND
jgi:hypothetical protein